MANFNLIAKLAAKAQELAPTVKPVEKAPGLSQPLGWAKEAESASAVKDSAPYFYEASRALQGVPKALSDAETERLIRAVQSGHNQIGYRYSRDPSRDEAHLIEMRDNWYDLPGESRGFHVDLTPGGPGASMRENNTRGAKGSVRPVSLRMNKVLNTTDEDANTLRFLENARRRGFDSLRYTPALGELAPHSNNGSVYERAIEVFLQGQDSKNPGVWQPSGAILKPENVRDLIDADFLNPKATGLKFAEGGSVKPDNKPSTTADVFKQLARGWAAGTTGLPGDIEGLARTLIKMGASKGSYVDRNMDDHPILPTSEFYRGWMPGADWETPEGGLAQDIGSALGGAGVGTITKGLVKGAKAVPGALTQVAKNAAIPSNLSAQAGVIKLPGGNWLNGSVADALKGLKRDGTVDIYDRLPPEVQSQVSAADGIDELQKRFPKEWAAAQSPMDQFIDKQMTRYVKNDMATERDPIRALADRGVLHVNPTRLVQGQGGVRSYSPADSARRTATPEGRVLSSGGDARLWEDAGDSALSAERLGSIPDWRKTNDEMNKVAPDTIFYEVRDPRTANNLGFDHLVDELRNATNPASGLPQHLLIDPSKLNQVSMSQAVQRVADINAWREAQKVEANAKLANNAATVLHKEYPENNPKGLRWVQLKIPVATLPEGYSIQTDPRNGLRVVLHPQGYPVSSGATDEEAINLIDRTGRKGLLEDALKYEGDTMGHCVGGYCNKVADGSTSIYSLRDAKGRPHVTVEVAPTKDLRTAKIDDTDHDPQNLPDSFRILQIKGKSNRKPNNEYLPFVQDFVKSGKWSDVGDLQNTGMMHRSKSAVEWPPNYGLAEIDKARAAFKGDPLDAFATELGTDYIAPADFHNWLGKQGFASGGSVPNLSSEVLAKLQAAGIDGLGNGYGFLGGGSHQTMQGGDLVDDYSGITQYTKDLDKDNFQGFGLDGKYAGDGYRSQVNLGQSALNFLPKMALVMGGAGAIGNMLGGSAAIGAGEAAASPLWESAKAAYTAAQPYTKAVGAIKSAVNGNPGAALASYLPGMDFGDATVNQFANPAIKSVVSGSNPVNGLINAGIGSVVPDDVKSLMPMVNSLVAASKGKLSVNQAISMISSLKRS